MSKPTYQDLYHLLLKHGQTAKSADDYLALVAKDLNFSEDDLSERYPSGEAIIRNRVRWAIHYLRRAHLLDKPSRGQYVITERGKEFIKTHTGSFNNNDLKLDENSKKNS